MDKARENTNEFSSWIKERSALIGNNVIVLYENWHQDYI